MNEALYSEALADIEKIFGDRMERAGEEADSGGLVVVSPVSVHEVELLMEVAGRYSLPIAAANSRRIRTVSR